MAFFTSRNILKGRNFLQKGVQGVAKGALLAKKYGTQVERAATGAQKYIPTEQQARSVLELTKGLKKMTV